MAARSSRRASWRAISTSRSRAQTCRLMPAPARPLSRINTKAAVRDLRLSRRVRGARRGPAVSRAVRVEEMRHQFDLFNGEEQCGTDWPAAGSSSCLRHPRVDQNQEVPDRRAPTISSRRAHTSLANWLAANSFSVRFRGNPVRTDLSTSAADPEADGSRARRRPSSSAPAGDEIYTDKYGRVKVQFHWDRYGNNDENSSCWIRVAQNVGGPELGNDRHPAGRAGGDRRLPRGRSGPARSSPGASITPIRCRPYALPANMTQTGIKSRSSQGRRGGQLTTRSGSRTRQGSRAGLLIHAEKDQDDRGRER
jgi:type VI secretion system secreted protein VgrG